MAIWIGVGAGVTVFVLALTLLFAWAHLGTMRIDTRREPGIRQRQYEAEAAMTRTIQNTIAEMFDVVRRPPC